MVSKGTTRCCVMTFNCLTMVIGAIILGVGIFVQIKGQEAFDMINEAGNKAAEQMGANSTNYDINEVIPVENLTGLIIAICALEASCFLCRSSVFAVLSVSRASSC
eukprot:JP446378.1.p1 GENE.JP446378.1~~JP446378.1.p1  ORF type:complete len:106 (+),score=20.64 JP446378.1:156-473(+)